MNYNVINHDSLKQEKSKVGRGAIFFVKNVFEERSIIVFNDINRK